MKNEASWNSIFLLFVTLLVCGEDGAGGSEEIGRAMVVTECFCVWIDARSGARFFCCVCVLGDFTAKEEFWVVE